MLPAFAGPAVFALDPRLEADTLPVGDLALTSVLLLNDARFPWFVLVPRRPDATELTDLSDGDAEALMREIRTASRVMIALAKPDKINVAALGNRVPQLHVHVIAASAPTRPGRLRCGASARRSPIRRTPRRR